MYYSLILDFSRIPLATEHWAGKSFELVWPGGQES